MKFEHLMFDRQVKLGNNARNVPCQPVQNYSANGHCTAQ